MSTPSEEKEAAPNDLSRRAAETYRWWDNLATINAEDPLWLGAAKIGIRLFGILVLLAMSPLIILGLVVAFFTVL